MQKSILPHNKTKTPFKNTASDKTKFNQAQAAKHNHASRNKQTASTVTSKTHLLQQTNRIGFNKRNTSEATSKRLRRHHSNIDISMCAARYEATKQSTNNKTQHHNGRIHTCT